MKKRSEIRALEICQSAGNDPSDSPLFDESAATTCRTNEVTEM